MKSDITRPELPIRPLIIILLKQIKRNKLIINHKILLKQT